MIEIYFNDLTEEAKTRLFNEGYDAGNSDIVPLAIIDLGDDGVCEQIVQMTPAFG